ncbi:MAG: beta strand repeat-containing protein, partial [Vicinamibacterales bacterium]
MTPTILASLSPEGPVDPTALQYGVPSREPTLFDLESAVDGAAGTLETDVTTTVDGGEGGGSEDPNYVIGTFSGGFEDWAPNQHLGDYWSAPMKLNISLVPADNEEIVSVTINGIPDGVTVYAPGQTVLGDGSNSITILAADLGSVYILPPADTDGDIPLDLTAEILDPDSGLTSLINADVIAVVDAVADKPGFVAGTSGEADEPDGGEQQIALFQEQVQGSTCVLEDHKVGLTLQAQFGDLDGSESHVLKIAPLPEEVSVASGDENGWTQNPDGSWQIDVTSLVDGSGFVSVAGPTLTPADDFNGTLQLDLQAIAAELVSNAANELTFANNVAVTDGSMEVCIRPVAEAPDVTVTPDAVVIKEDGSGEVVITASTTDSSDELYQVVIGNLPSGWGIVVDDGGAGGGFDLGTGIYSAAGGVSTVTLTVTLTTPEDSDSDIVPELSVTASAIDGSSIVSSDTKTVNVDVDAILDEAANVAQAAAPGVLESAAPQTISLGLDFSMVNAGFTGSGAGGTDSDGTESITGVTVHVSAGTLVTGAGWPAGVDLNDLGGGDYSITGFTGAAQLEAAVEALSVEVPAGFDGAINGTITTTTAEQADTVPNPNPGDSGDEYDLTDNSVTQSFEFGASVTAVAEPPRASITVGGDGHFKEDAANTVHLAASAGDSTDQLTTVVVAGLAWGVSPAALSALEALADVASASFAAGTLTITLEPGVESFAHDLELTPPEDSDVDLSGVSITANVADKTDPSATNSAASAPITLVVDAVLDDYADAGQGAAPSVSEQTGAQTIDLNLSLASGGAGFAHSGAGGEDTDGSEAVTGVEITLSTGTLVLAGYAGSAALTDNGGGSYTLSGWSDFADLQAAVDALSAEVPGGFDGAITGQLGITTAEANTPAGAAPASGAEPDESDNVRTDVTGFSASVTGEAGTPTASIAVNGSGYFKEDAANTVHLAASAGDSTDQLTTVVVAGLAWGVSPAALSALEALADVASASFAAGTLTITLEPGVESFAHDLELTPPEDSDVDLSGVSITANVADKTDPSATNSAASAPITLVVDAVLDDYADAGGAAASGNEAAGAQQIALGLSLAMVDTGPGVPGAAWNAPSDEPSDTTVADGDGSESFTVSITVDASATAAGVDLVLDSAPAGAALDETAPGSGVWALSVASPADLSAAVAAVKASVPAGYDGTVTGSIAAASSEANTPAGAAPASGAEPDISDNSVNDSATWTLTVEPGDGTPNVVLAGLTAGQLVIKEDNSGSFTVTASTVDATDSLTAVTFGNLNLPAGWTVTVSDGGAGGSYSAATGVYTPAGTTTSVVLTVTITPPEDADADVANVMPGDISVSASAQDLDGGPVFT